MRDHDRVDARIIPRLEYLPDTRPRGPQSDSALVQFVGGPRDGERELLGDTPAVIHTERGTYRRSVRCADDGALRYVFDDDSIRIAHERWIRPC